MKFQVDPEIYNNVRNQLDRIAKGWQTYLHCGDDDASAVKLAIKIQGWKRGLFLVDTFHQQGRVAFLIGAAPVAKKSGTCGRGRKKAADKRRRRRKEASAVTFMIRNPGLVRDMPTDVLMMLRSVRTERGPKGSRARRVKGSVK